MPGADNSPARLDAALVYRALRAAGVEGRFFLELADACFPVPGDGPPSSVRALRRRSVTRVFEAVSWMRMRGVVIACSPSPHVDDDSGVAHSRFVWVADPDASLPTTSTSS